MIRPKFERILEELKMTLSEVSEEQVARMVECIVKAPHIYFAGVGRSGNLIRTFAMRMMHAGLNAYVVGDTATPGAQPGDLLIVGSGSGETESLMAYVAKAKRLGLHVITITSFADSSLARAADHVLQIPAPTPKSDKASKFTSFQPMANLYEQSFLICLDAVSMEVMEALGLDSDTMFKRHANLE
ncbi:6-phospho-3-hexuloisomerase [Diplocloster hominis]|uniref:6-phospho-3-hexuloisomerase n=1 Tax=Diplocloster hominis TaxID=3079010 RepID=UPI0031BAAAAE